MEKKRSVGITIFAIFFLIVAILTTYKLFKEQSWKAVKEQPWKVVLILTGSLDILIPLLISFGLYNLKKWSRNLALFYVTIGLAISLITTFIDKSTRILRILKIENLSFRNFSFIQWIVLVLSFVWGDIIAFLLLFLLWWFFTRPKVKEQFK